MGKSNSATASIGIKISIRDLLVQICDANITVVKYVLVNGMVEDENDELNEIFSIIVSENLELESMDLKDYLYNEFTQNNLIDAVLLVHIKTILTTERWGYEREGINCSSRPLDFDLSVDLTQDSFHLLEHTELVFILDQCAG